MKISELAKVSPEFRMYRKAVTLLTSMEKRIAWFEDNKELPRTTMEGYHWYRYMEVRKDLLEHIDRLDKNVFISHTPPKWLTMPVGELLDTWVFESLRVPGPAVHDDFMQCLVEEMNEKGRSKRAAEHYFSLLCEIADRTRRGWFLVFNTLTVGPEFYRRVFARGSVEFKEYIRGVDRAVARRAFGSVRAARASGEEYHSYFACVEEGARYGRLHIHVLHCMSCLPEGAYDPNAGYVQPTKRELSVFKRWWSHGWSTPIAVRYGQQDAFSQAGYRWVYDRKTQQGLATRSPLAIGAYMSKYVIKSYISEKRSKYVWRIRKSQRLGRQVLVRLLQPLSLKSLCLVASDPTMAINLNNRRVAPGPLREEAIRLLLSRSSISPLSLGMVLDSAPSLVQRLQGLGVETLLSNLQRTMSSVISTMNGRDISEEDFQDAHLELIGAAADIDLEYFPRSAHAYATTSTRLVV